MANNKDLLAAINAQVAASKNAFTAPPPVSNAAPVGPSGYGTTSTVDTNFVNANNPNSAQNQPSLLNRIIDVISRPTYAVKNVIRDQLDTDPNNNNPLESAGAGFLGYDKTSARDIIDAMDQRNGSKTPDWIKGLVGFAGDVALDPTTYTTFGAGTAIKAGLKTADRALSGAGKFEAASKAALTADDVTKADVKAALDSKLIAQRANVTNTARQADIAADVVKTNDVLPTVVQTNTVPGTKPIVNTGPDGLPVVNTTSRAPQEPLFRSIQQQSNTARSITNEAIKDAQVYEGPLKDQFLTQRVLPELQRIKEENIQKGIYPVVKVNKNEYHLDVADVFNSLGPKVLDHYIKPTNGLSAGTITNAAARAVEIKQAGISGQEALTSLTQYVEKGRITSRAKNLAQDLWNNVDDIERRVIDNEYTLGHRDLVTGKKIGQDVAEETTAKLADPNVGVAENFQDVANINGKIKNEADAQGVSVGGAIVGAHEAINALPPEVVSDIPIARSTLADSRDVAKGADNSRISNRQMALMRADTRKQLEADPHVSLDNMTDITVGNAIQRGYAGLQSRMIHGFRQGDLANAYRNWNGPAEVLQHVYTTQIAKVYKDFGDTTTNAAFNALKVGGVAARVTDPEVAGAVEALKPLLEHVLSTSTGPAAGRDIVAESALFRSGLDVKTINMLLKEKGIPHQFENIGGKLSMPEIAQQWKDWNIKDPLDFLSKYQAAAVAGVARQKVGQAFTLKFGKDVPEPGFIKIKQTDAKMSRFIDPNKYYPPEAIHQMRMFNNTFDSPTSFRGGTGAAAWLANHVIDPFLRIWKPSVTIVRPGHHIRNAMGDFIMNGMAGVWSPKHYIKAANIQRALGKFTGDSAELEKLMGAKLPDAGATAFSVALKDGSREPFSYAQAGQLGFKHGLMTSYRAAEDILEKNAVNKLDVLTDKIMESAPMRLAGKISETENTHFKLAQYSALMSDAKFTSKFKSVEDASMAAVTEVQKFHPDTKGLAPFEAKVMRRVAPFYTWFRQAMPMVFNTLLTKPGRVTVVPKAYFNTSVAMGLDPQSMENPFPADKMYPSFIQDHLTGPLNAFGKDFIMNTGTPVEGAGDILNGNVPSNLMSMINPLIKAPVELATQRNLISGSFIPDRGEYIDQLIPFGNQASNITGYSIGGTIANTLSGNTSKTPGRIDFGPLNLDPQRAVQKNEKDFLFNQSTLNFLSGMGVQNLDRPSYQKITAKEAKG